MKKMLFVSIVLIALLTSCGSAVSPKSLVQEKLDSIAASNGWDCELTYISEPYSIDYVEKQNDDRYVNEYYGDDKEKFFFHLALRLSGVGGKTILEEEVIEKDMQRAIDRDKFIKKYKLEVNYYMLFYRFKMTKKISGDSQEFIGFCHLDSAKTEVKHFAFALHY